LTQAFDQRPDPAALLAKIERERRARLRIYLGASPGVGKTFAMLEEGALLKKRGVDVVIGIVETHGRADTEAKIGDLEIIPRKIVEYRNVTLEEIDVEAVIARRPQIVIVDELAHTNAPGLKNVKRYEDILDLLDAGVGVMTAVNIQHLETLNDAVRRSSGIQVKETIPDTFLRRADEIINVDVTVEELRTRLRRGKIYGPEKVEQALRNFFRTGNLSTLRELALRTVAEEVGTKAAEYRQREGLEPAQIPEKVMVCMSSNVTAERLVRTGARIAGRFGARWYAVYVETPSENERSIRPADARQLAQNFQLAEELGGVPIRLVTPHAADGLIDFARREGVTHVIFGQTARSRWRLLLSGSILDRFLREVTDAAVQVIPSPKAPRPRPALTGPLECLISVGGVFLTVFVLRIVAGGTNAITAALCLLLVVLASATRFGLWPSILTSVTGVLCFNFFFLPPLGTFTIADPENWVALLAFLLTAVIVSRLTATLKARRLEAESRQDEIWKLYQLSRVIIAAPEADSTASLVTGQVGETFKSDYCAIFARNDGKRWERLAVTSREAHAFSPTEAMLARAFESGEPIVDADTERTAYIPLKVGLRSMGVMVLRSPRLGVELAEAAAGLVALALERSRFIHELSRAEALKHSDELKSALLASVSHNLRTPLTSIRAAVDNLMQDDIAWDAETRREFHGIIREETERLSAIVRNLLEMARIEAGELKIDRRWTAPAEIVSNVLSLSAAALREHRVDVDADESSPLVFVDARLIGEALSNLLENAAKYSPAGSVIRVAADVTDKGLSMRVADEGAGIPPDALERIFDKFYRGENANERLGTGMGLAIAKGIVNAHGGAIRADNAPDGGSVFSFFIPAASKPAEVFPEE
jgi:two-component system sensor histidine kinase KdpD